MKLTPRETIYFLRNIGAVCIIDKHRMCEIKIFQRIKHRSGIMSTHFISRAHNGIKMGAQGNNRNKYIGAKDFPNLFSKRQM